MSDGDIIESADGLTLAFFQLASLQAQNTMRLSYALRNDPNVSDETRKAADNAFESVQEMLNLLGKISKTAWGVELGAEIEND